LLRNSQWGGGAEFRKPTPCVSRWGPAIENDISVIDRLIPGVSELKLAFPQPCSLYLGARAAQLKIVAAQLSIIEVQSNHPNLTSKIGLGGGWGTLP